MTYKRRRRFVEWRKLGAVGIGANSMTQLDTLLYAAAWVVAFISIVSVFVALDRIARGK